MSGTCKCGGQMGECWCNDIQDKMNTSDGRTITGKELQNARLHVSAFFEDNALSVRQHDKYASHVSEGEKDHYLTRDLIYADEIAKGEHDNNFTIWQRMNEFITGECVALLG